MTESPSDVPPGRSRLIVLAGPTAVGKGTVAADVRRTHPEVWLSVSATTRPPRPGEENGVHYWFVSDDDFDAMIEKGDLLEYVGPLVDTHVQEKPLSIALREINDDLLTCEDIDPAAEAAAAEAASSAPE